MSRLGELRWAAQIAGLHRKHEDLRGIAWHRVDDPTDILPPVGLEVIVIVRLEGAAVQYRAFAKRIKHPMGVSWSIPGVVYWMYAPPMPEYKPNWRDKDYESHDHSGEG